MEPLSFNVPVDARETIRKQVARNGVGNNASYHKNAKKREHALRLQNCRSQKGYHMLRRSLHGQRNYKKARCVARFLPPIKQCKIIAERDFTFFMVNRKEVCIGHQVLQKKDFFGTGMDAAHHRIILIRRANLQNTLIHQCSNSCMTTSNPARYGTT